MLVSITALLEIADLELEAVIIQFGSSSQSLKQTYRRAVNTINLVNSSVAFSCSPGIISRNRRFLANFDGRRRLDT